MNKILLNFIESFHEINPELTETIAKKFVFVFMEGEYDISFVFSANDIIKDIVAAIRGRDGVHSAVHLAKSGFEVHIPTVPINVNGKPKFNSLMIRWLVSETNKSSFSLNQNLIIIEFDHPYDGTKESAISVVNSTNRSIVHELRHWYDAKVYNMKKNPYTRISQIENSFLKMVDESAYAICNDAYFNNTTEMNAYVSELIYAVLRKFFGTREHIQFDELIHMARTLVDMRSLTDDMKRRLLKRLYVFWKSLNSLEDVKDKSTPELCDELIKHIQSATGIVESIDYSHSDIIHKKNIVFFEANYRLDSGYRKWFDSKYPNRISFLESANKSVII